MDVDPDCWTARNFLAFWWIYIVAILAVFSGFLVARLSYAESILPFHNVPELAKLADKGVYKLCLVDGTSTVDDIRVKFQLFLYFPV